MIRFGTRGSQLALAQTQWFQDQFTAMGHANTRIVIKTQGDVVMDRFDKMEGKGFFTKEIEDALIAEKIDAAVHSMKDLPSEMPGTLRVSAIPARASTSDLLISRKPLLRLNNGFPDLNGKTVGTSSVRRVQCIQAQGIEADFVPVRGNVTTRLSKIDSQGLDAILLARAGLDRLGLDLSTYHVMELSPEQMVPAPGQGALALQTRGDLEVNLERFNHPETAHCVGAERWLAQQLGGGCQLPLGILIQSCQQGFEIFVFLGTMGDRTNPRTCHLHGEDPMALAQQALATLKAA